MTLKTCVFFQNTVDDSAFRRVDSQFFILRVLEVFWRFFSHMDVSKNSGTPKWMVKIMENLIKMDDLGGKNLYFWKHPYHFPYRNSNLVPYYEASHQLTREEESGTLATDSRLKEDLRPRVPGDVATASGEGLDAFWNWENRRGTKLVIYDA